MKLTWSVVKHAAKKRMPEILLGASIGGAVATTGFTVLGTVKTVRKLDELAQEETETHHVDTVDKVKAVWKYYIPSAIMLGGTIFCICELNAVHIRKEAALAAIGTMWKTKYKNLEEAVKDGGDKQAKEIKEKALSKELKGTPQNGSGEVRPVAGTLRCFEPFSRQKFEATEQQLLWAELNANKELQARGFLTLNELLSMLPGCKKCTFGDEFGWFNNRDLAMCVAGTPFIDFSTTLQDIDNSECAVLQYSIKPSTMLAEKYDTTRRFRK